MGKITPDQITRLNDLIESGGVDSKKMEIFLSDLGKDNAPKGEYRQIILPDHGGVGSFDDGDWY